jgi:Dyp-type peroxidase family
MAASLKEMLDNREPIKEGADRILGDKAYTELFKDLQSNILTPHGRDRAQYWLIRFDPDPTKVVETKYLFGMLARNAFERVMIRQAVESTDAGAVMSEALKEVAKQWKEGAPGKIDIERHKLLKPVCILSEYEMYWQRKAERASAAQGARTVSGAPEVVPLSVNVLLTCKGYEKLGVLAPPSDAFKEGMEKRGKRLNDPAPSKWEERYCDGVGAAEIDALLIVAHDPLDPDVEPASLHVLRAVVKEHATIVHEEKGRVLRVNAREPDGIHGESDALQRKSYVIEPFGFRDSISQPMFYDSQRHQLGDQKLSPGKQWDPFAPLRLALCPDPNGKSLYACGTYFVFRKLAQDIALFYRQARKIEDQSGVDAGELRARFIGRRPDGTPLFPAGHRNEFDFRDDPDGKACPFHAHVRKSNPRGDVRENYGPKEHRIVRRGISYGPTIERDDSGAPTAAGLQECERHPDAIGLLFLCAQSEIENQFEYIQGQWANQPNHPRGKPSGVDAITGQSVDGGSRIAVEDKRPGGAPSVGLMVDYKQIVTLKGGGYFFAPSISFLRGLLDDLLKL